MKEINTVDTVENEVEEIEVKESKLAKVGNYVKMHWKRTVATVAGIGGAFVLGYIIAKDGDCYEDPDDYSLLNTDDEVSNDTESVDE